RVLAAVVPRWRRVARVEWVMDVYPDVLAAHGILGRGAAPFRFLESRARGQLRSAAAGIARGPFRRRPPAPPRRGVRGRPRPLHGPRPRDARRRPPAPHLGTPLGGGALGTRAGGGRRADA